MRSSASAGLFGTGSGLASASRPSCGARAARSSSSSAPRCGRVTGSETTDQRNRLGSFLSASAVKTCVPSGRSLGAMVIGTSNSGAKFCAHVELGILAAHEHRDLAGTPRRFGLGGAFSAPGRRAVSFFTSGDSGLRGASAVAWRLRRLSAGLDSRASASARFRYSSSGLRLRQPWRIAAVGSSRR